MCDFGDFVAVKLKCTRMSCVYVRGTLENIRVLFEYVRYINCEYRAFFMMCVMY